MTTRSHGATTCHLPPNSDADGRLSQRPVDLVAAADRVARVAKFAAQEHDETTTFPREAFQAIATAGLLAAPLAAELGGAGFERSDEGRLCLLNVLRAVGRGDLSTGRIYEGHVNALQLIQAFGSPRQIVRWASDARDRKLLFSVWNTEDDDPLRLLPVSGGLRLEGVKTYASGAGHVERPLITARLPDGTRQMCVVPMERACVTIDHTWWQPMGMRASVSHRIDFSGVMIDQDDLLGVPGDYDRQPWLGAGAVRFAAVQLGGAEALLEAACAHLRSLDRTGDPHQQTRIGEGALRVESGRLWLPGVARHVRLEPDAAARGDADRSLAYANMMRTAIAEICQDVIEIAVRAAGARVLIQPHTIERIVRDLTVYLRQPAPDAALAHAGAFALTDDSPAGAPWHDC